MITGTNKPSPTGGYSVHIGGIPLDPGPSQRLYNHSPDGFAWGYYGSGPAQLALAILLHFSNEQVAVKYYQRFKEEIIAPLPANHFHLRESRVKKWLSSIAGYDRPSLSKVPGKNAKKPEGSDLR